MTIKKIQPFHIDDTKDFVFGNITTNGSLVSSGNVNLGPIANVTISGGTSGYVLSTDGSGNLSWVEQNTSGTPGGSNTQVQFNDNGSFAGSSSFVFDKTSTTLTVNNFVSTSTANLGSISNVTITGGSANYVLSTDGSGTLTWVAPPSSTSITNGNSNVSISSSGGNITASVNGNSNIFVITDTGANVNGTLDVSGVITGNGSGLTNLAGANVTGTVANATYAVSAGSATTASTVTTNAQPNITSVGTLTTLSVTGNIDGANVNANFFGSGAGLTSIPGANVTGTVANATYAVSAGSATTATSATTASTVTTASQPNITSVGTLVDLSVTGNAVIGGNLVVNGTLEYTNVDTLAVKDPIIGLGRGANNAPLTTDDNKDRGEQLWYYNGSEKSAFIGWDDSAGKLIAAVDVTNSSEVITVNSYGNFVVGGLESTTISATGNITGDYVIGNGSSLTSLNGANVTGEVANAAYATSAGSADTATTAGTVTTSAQPNITSVGTLENLTANGTINLSDASNISLGDISNIHISGGSNGYVLTTDGAGNLSWAESSSPTIITASWMPYQIDSSEHYLIPANRQGLFSLPIDIGDGILEVDGILVEV